MHSSQQVLCTKFNKCNKCINLDIVLGQKVRRSMSSRRNNPYDLSYRYTSNVFHAFVKLLDLYQKIFFLSLVHICKLRRPAKADVKLKPMESLLESKVSEHPFFSCFQAHGAYGCIVLLSSHSLFTSVMQPVLFLRRYSYFTNEEYSNLSKILVIFMRHLLQSCFSLSIFCQQVMLQPSFFAAL